MQPIRPHSRSTVAGSAWLRRGAARPPGPVPPGRVTPPAMAVRGARAGIRPYRAGRRPRRGTPGRSPRRRRPPAAGRGCSSGALSGVTGKFRAHLADPVAQADHVVEPLPGERAHGAWLTAADVDAVLQHHPDRVGVQRLRVAARAGRLIASPASCSANASAIWERALFPVHKNSTRTRGPELSRRGLGRAAGPGAAPPRRRPAVRRSAPGRPCSRRHGGQRRCAGSTPARRPGARPGGRRPGSAAGRAGLSARGPAGRCAPVRSAAASAAGARPAARTPAGGRVLPCDHPVTVHQANLIDQPADITLRDLAPNGWV